MLQAALPHSEITIRPDLDIVARGILTIVPVCNADFAIRPDVDASGVKFVGLVALPELNAVLFCALTTDAHETTCLIGKVKSERQFPVAEDA